MANHAVGGVDRLVECGAGEPADGHPEHRRDNGVRKIFGETFDGGAGDACGIERGRVTSDDPRHRDAAGRNAVALERYRNLGHVPVQTSLRDQRAGQRARGQHPERDSQQRVCSTTRATAPTTIRRARIAAIPAARRCAAPSPVPIERMIEPRDYPAHPCHRMADRAEQGLRVAEAEFDQHGDQGKR